MNALYAQEAESLVDQRAATMGPDKAACLKHLQTQVAQLRPRHPLHIAAWLASLPPGRLLPEAQAVARELALWAGHGHTPQAGCRFTRKPLGNGEVLIEYEYERGDPGRTYGEPGDCYPPEPERCAILQVLINGMWEDAQDTLPAALIERWEQEICGEEA